jgi:hypothetical protein
MLGIVWQSTKGVILVNTARLGILRLLLDSVNLVTSRRKVDKLMTPCVLHFALARAIDESPQAAIALLQAYRLSLKL